MQCFSTDHPECREGEIYLGNFAPNEALRIGLKSKRRGEKAFCSDGSPYPDQHKYKVFPYFADKVEFDSV